jgi:hypothetical protein
MAGSCRGASLYRLKRRAGVSFPGRAPAVQANTATALISISASLRTSPLTTTPVAAGHGGPLNSARRTSAVFA